MADTGEDREIKQRVEANEAEAIRESKQLVANTKEAYGLGGKRKALQRLPKLITRQRPNR